MMKLVYCILCFHQSQNEGYIWRVRVRGSINIGMASAECHSVTSFNTIDVQVSSYFVWYFIRFVCYKVDGGSRWDCLSRLTIYVE